MPPRRRPPKKEPRGQRDLSRPVQAWDWQVGEPEHGARLDEFLAQRLRWRSRASLRRAIEDGRVEISPNKDPQQAEIGRLRAGLRLRRGQEVVIRLNAPHVDAGLEAAAWQPGEVPVVFEDDDLLAVSKPPHLSVYPSRRHRGGSLIQRVHARESETHGETAYPPTLCHRLDRETSGLVLFARNRAARAHLNRQFEERTVAKTYLALVEGAVEGDDGRIDKPLGRALESAVEIKMGVREAPDGRPAVTRWRVSRRFSGRTLLEVAPETGRQHQIRVHLAAIGHPLVGDKLYLGGDEVFLRSLEGDLRTDDLEKLGLGRHALHAWRLEVDHPSTQRRTRLEAPLWPDLDCLMEELSAR